MSTLTSPLPTLPTTLGRYTLWLGILLLFLGISGVVLPGVMSLTTDDSSATCC